MAFKNSSVDNGGTTTGYDPAPVVPTGALEGDFMVAVVLTTDNSPSIAPTAPSGWTLESAGSMPIDGTGAASPPAVWIYSKDVTADDETNAGTKTYQWTFSGSEEQLAAIFLFDPTAFGQFAKNEVSGVHTTIDAPSITTTTANELYYYCAMKDSGTENFSSGPGGTQRLSETLGSTSGAGATIKIFESTQVTPGATGAGTFTHSSEESNGFTFSVAAAAGGGGTVPVFVQSYRQRRIT